MGGFRQFGVLLKKNTLLKARRPYATCFELSMPVVLFLLLAYTRSKYEIKSYGPFDFAHNPIFPISRMLMGNASETSMVDVAMGQTDGMNVPDVGAGASSMVDETHQLMGNLSLQHVLGALAVDMEPKLLCEPGFVSSMAEYIEPVLAMNHSGGTLAKWVLGADAEYEAKKISDTALHLEKINMSEFALWLGERRTAYLASDWKKRAETVASEADAELAKLRAELKDPNGAGAASARAKGWIDDMCGLKGGIVDKMNVNGLLNFADISKDVVCFRDAVDDCFKTADIKTTTADPASAVGQLKDMVNQMNANTITLSMTDALEMAMKAANEGATTIAGMMANMSESSSGNSEATWAAEMVDDMAWWLSHFIRSRGSVARLLGETTSDPLATMSPMDMSINPSWGSDLKVRTHVAGAVFSGVTMIQKSDMMKEMNKSIMDMTKTETTKVATMQKDGEKIIDDMIYDLKKLIEDLEKMWAEISKPHTAAHIETVVMPKWAQQWRTACPKMFNSTAFGATVAKMHSGCPFYREMVRKTEDTSMTQWVNWAHGELSKWDSWKSAVRVNRNRSTSRCPLHYINSTKIHKAVKDTFAEVQTKMQGSSDPKIVAGHLSKELHKQWQHMRGLPSCTIASTTEFSSLMGSMTKSVTDAENSDLTKAAEKSANDMWTMLVQRYGGLLDTALGLVETLTGGDNPETASDLDGGGKEYKDKDKPGQQNVNRDAQSYLTNELMRRKIIVAPYTGESKKVIDLALVEMALSVTQKEYYPEEVRPLMRCPLVRAAIAKGAEVFLRERMMTFSTEAELENYASLKPNDILVALVFRSADHATGDFPKDNLNVEYSIRLHAQLLPKTSRILRISRYAMFGATRVSSYPYLDVGFTHLQEVIGRAVARLRVLREAQGNTGRRLSETAHLTEVGRNIYATNRTELGRRLSVAMEQFPAPEYQLDGFIRVIQHTLPMFMILGWIYAVSLLVKEIVYEKQERLRDVMRIMGLKTWVYWSSWVCSAMIQMTALVGIMTFILCASKVLKHSDPLVVFLFFWLYSLATVSLSMLISSFFSRAKVAAACAGLAYYCAYMPYSIFNRFEDVLPLDGKNALCLLSSTGLGVGMSIIAKWELIEVGVQWDNIGSPSPLTYSGAAPKDAHSLGHVMMMMIVDCVFYQVLAWYLEKVFPGTLGLPQPWYFPVLPSYWRGPVDVEAGSDNIITGSKAEQEDNKKLEYWEAAHDDLKPMVQIRGLSKVFTSGRCSMGGFNKTALGGVSIDMHEGMILGYLGHNGAGKSTTMSVLTGLYPPTEGDVHVNGISVRKDSHGVRKQLGVCLQHNALWDNLTVEEHLWLFCCLKSVPWDQMRTEVDKLLRDTGLEPKRHAPSRGLSGGMKRKLSIGIALAGGSKVITLDEPTAGVDATSRRDIWQLLANYREGRTILLSTHFMDEADILSNRIAIIAEGHLTAIGCGMNLKKHFADGYMLTIVSTDAAEVKKIHAVVKTAVPLATLAGTRGCEVSYTLPFSSRGSFSTLFAQLQDSALRKRLGIDTYGLSAATMEEVFLRASSVHEVGLKGQIRNGGEDGQAEFARQVTENSGEGNSQGESDLSTREASNDGLSRTSPSDASDSGEQKSSPPSLSGEKEFDGVTPPMSESGTTPTGDAKAADDAPEPSPQSPQCMSNPSEEPKKKKEKKVKSPIVETDVELQSPKLKTIGANELLWGPPLAKQQFIALFIKRLLSVKRDFKAWGSQLLLPMTFVCLALAVAKLLEIKEVEPPLKLTTEMFVGTQSAGAVTQSFVTHTSPFVDMRNDEFGASIADAFAKTYPSSNKLEHIGGHDRATMEPEMGAYLLDNRADLDGTFGAISLGSTQAGPNMTLWFDNQAYHSIPVMVNLWTNARMRLLGYDDTSAQVWNHPLPKTEQLLTEEMTGASQIFTDLTVAITTILAMGFIPASFIVYLVHERATNGKHQQLLTGVSPSMYWITSYCWDCVNFFVPMCVCMILFSTSTAYGGSNAPAMFLLLIAYGACMTPNMYCLEWLFKVPSTAYVTLICLNIFTGTVSVMAVTILEFYQAEVPDLAPVCAVCKAVFPWLLPNYCLGRGMIEIAMNYYKNYAMQEFGLCEQLGRASSCTTSPLDWDVAGRFLFALLVMAPVWLFYRLLIEWGCCLRNFRRRALKMLKENSPPASFGVDEAVKREAERVKAAESNGPGTSGQDVLVISELVKSFARNNGCCDCRGKQATVLAVRGVSVGVPIGECFGLLGVNGAGKTTTMRMVTGDTEIEGGDVRVGGWSVQGQRDKARRHLGYCPQFDALPDKLTVRETLALYARIRGVPGGEVNATVEIMIQKMCLENHASQRCEHLSGGNRRKLSTALSLIGEPDVILLDEPSTGVDVGARRFLWDVIGDLRASGRAIVLTSHSMEECEVLCTRLTIMVHGQMRCLGSPMQLKDKYGGGYTLTIKTELDNKDGGEAKSPAGQVKEFMAETQPKARLTEQSVGLLRYRLGGRDAGGGDDVRLADVFKALEASVAEGGALHGCATDYTISQTSLEEVFLYFSQEAEKSDGFVIAQEAAVVGIPVVGENPTQEPIDLDEL
jgi:ABC-type multidrug transport system ATPase subunit